MTKERPISGAMESAIFDGRRKRRRGAWPLNSTLDRLCYQCWPRVLGLIQQRYALANPFAGVKSAAPNRQYASMPRGRSAAVEWELMHAIADGLE
ncbi:hypothetical protein [Cupriavidus sp. H39]|uniref:hypothetical protein n=1 Tax=Cupriavidus sp. H39 TaxID=3401635 RepID=UPI003D065707